MKINSRAFIEINKIHFNFMELKKKVFKGKIWDFEKGPINPEKYIINDVQHLGSYLQYFYYLSQ